MLNTIDLLLVRIPNSSKMVHLVDIKLEILIIREINIGVGFSKRHSEVTFKDDIILAFFVSIRSILSAVLQFLDTGSSDNFRYRKVLSSSIKTPSVYG